MTIYFSRCLCGCVRASMELRGQRQEITLSHCNGKDHTGSHCPMNDDEVFSALMAIQGTIRAAKEAGHYANSIGKRHGER